MTNSLDNLITNCRTVINADGYDLDAIQGSAEKAAADPAFVARYFGPEAEEGTHTLYTDPDTGFMILAHIKDEGFKSKPHDHGASWAVYCQIAEYVEMKEYRRLDDGTEAGTADLEMTRDYRLEPGQAGYFDAFQIHSIHVPDKARFLRITGTNLSRIETQAFDMEAGRVTVIPPNDDGKVSGDSAA